jgi:hypothetical protein
MGHSHSRASAYPQSRQVGTPSPILKIKSLQHDSGQVPANKSSYRQSPAGKELSGTDLRAMIPFPRQREVLTRVARLAISSFEFAQGRLCGLRRPQKVLNCQRSSAHLSRPPARVETLIPNPRFGFKRNGSGGQEKSEGERNESNHGWIEEGFRIPG